MGHKKHPLSPIDTLVLLRQRLGLTQGKLASTAGFARETVSKIETHAVDPQLSTLEAYARALGAELMVVPSELRAELEAFVRSGGLWLGQPTGVGAPRSIVDEVLERSGPPEDVSGTPRATYRRGSWDAAD